MSSHKCPNSIPWCLEDISIFFEPDRAKTTTRQSRLPCGHLDVEHSDISPGQQSQLSTSDAIRKATRPEEDLHGRLAMTVLVQTAHATVSPLKG